MNVHALMRKLLLLVTLLSLAAAPGLGYAQTPSSDDSSDGEDVEVKGLVEAVPAASSLGEWKVAGKSFVVNAATVFFGFGDARPGVGRCVEVKLTTTTPPAALQIEPDDDCGAPGQPDDLGWRGTVTAAPAGGFTGNWTIGGKSFTANAGTFFLGFGDTPPAVGACVEVEYIVEGTANIATSIHPEDDCRQPGLPPQDHLYRARVDARPATRFGTWIIGGRSFEAVDGTTIFSALFGADVAKPTLGDCVRVLYSESNNVRTIRELSPGTCERPDDAPGRFEAHGPLTARPADPEKVGTWTIGGINYTATLTTELKTEFGPLTLKSPPVCVKVHYGLGAAGERIAREIESRPDFRCTSSGDAHELYGEIKQLPASPYLGTWLIGTIEVQVTRATRLESGPFVVGRTVEVKFTRAGDGTLIAVKIEGKGSSSGDDSQRERERARGKAYGAIEALPGGGPVAGDWTIAGQVYAVTAGTLLRDGGTAFAVSACVEVHFRADAAGKRTAVKIERGEGDDCTATVGERGRSYGFATAMPTSGYTGTWTVGGVVYKVVAATEFEFESHVGAPAVGSFVEVKYIVEGGEKIAREITTRVPPGMGDDSYVGKLDDSASINSLAATGTWKVGGLSFQVTDATLIQDGPTSVANGALVRVNGYRDAQGTLVATEVAAVSAALYLPIVQR